METAARPRDPHGHQWGGLEPPEVGGGPFLLFAHTQLRLLCCGSLGNPQSGLGLRAGGGRTQRSQSHLCSPPLSPQTPRSLPQTRSHAGRGRGRGAPPASLSLISGDKAALFSDTFATFPDRTETVFQVHFSWSSNVWAASPDQGSLPRTPGHPQVSVDVGR